MMLATAPRTGRRTDYELLSARYGFSRPVCDMLCRVLQTLPGHLDPFKNANVVAFLEQPAAGTDGFFAGMPEGARHDRCPSFASKSAGARQGTFPDVSVKHPEQLRWLRLLLAAMERAGFPQTAPRSRAAAPLPGEPAAAY